MIGNTPRILCDMSWQDAVRRLMREQELTQEQLADRLGMTQGGLGHWLNGRRSPSLDDFKRMASSLSVPLAKILFHELELPGEVRLDDNVSLPQGDSRLRPLISTVPAGSCREAIDNLQPGDAEEWLPGSPKGGRRTFMLRVDGQSQMPKYQDGMIIEVDPDVVPENGSDVVARLPDGSVTFKQLQIDSGRQYLVARNPQWPERIIKVPEGTVICGVVIWAMFDPRSWK